MKEKEEQTIERIKQLASQLETKEAVEEVYVLYEKNFERISQETAKNFKVGEQVKFEEDDGNELKGEIIRKNRQTITVEGDDETGRRYKARVNPSRLERVEK